VGVDVRRQLTTLAAVMVAFAAASCTSESPPATTASTAAAAPTTTVAATTAPSTAGSASAACTSQVLLPLLKQKFDNPPDELVIERVDIRRCRNGYAHVFAVPRSNRAGQPQYDSEQLFLREVDGSWESVAEGGGISCSDADVSGQLLQACQALGYR
jgi:hypothetical protein